MTDNEYRIVNEIKIILVTLKKVSYDKYLGTVPLLAGCSYDYRVRGPHPYTKRRTDNPPQADKLYLSRLVEDRL